MRIALVSSAYPPGQGALERHVDRLARGLAARGAKVEVLTQHPGRRVARLVEAEGVLVRRFAAPLGSGHGALSPALCEYLRRRAASFDLVHVHTAHAPLGLAVARAHARRMVFSPHAPMHRLLRWPYTRVTGGVLQQAVRISPMSNAEGDLIRRRFTHLAERVHVVPTGVDGAAIRAARGLSDVPDHTVLTVARLERHKRVDRTVAAMAAVPPAYRLAVVGAGPALRWLAARAADLRVASRVQFVGAVADDLLYRWLRTAHVLVSVAEQDASGAPVMEALSAGAPVVATDIPVHREAAAFVPGAPIVFVPSEPSPLRIADAVLEASGMSTASSAALALPCWDTVVESTCALYEELLGKGTRRNGSSRNGSSPNGSSPNGSSPNGSSPNGKEHFHVNGNGRGRSLQVEA